MRFDNINFDLLAGQRLMVGFEGTELNSELKALISDLKVGGIILFAL
ncbi:MAG: beta-N-acetylhexosaminidase, partial [Desulfamplus sp.]|nr:beta-N-acetylhexosaminidase [Desulfamplus sp.]